MADSRNKASSHCITQADVKKPKEDFFGAGQVMQIPALHHGRRKNRHPDGVHEEGSTQTTNMSGTYTPNELLNGHVVDGSGGDQNGMSMKMHVDCSASASAPAKMDRERQYAR